MTENKRKVLFFDIDGTLFSEKTMQIPESAIEALKRAKANGHVIFVNTGRTICSVPKILYEIGVDGFVCGCGTYIEYKNEVLLTKPIERKRGHELVEKMLKCKIYPLLEGVEDAYLPREITPYQAIEYIRGYMTPMGVGVTTFAEDNNYEYDKIFMVADENSDKESFFEEIKDQMVIIDRRNGVYECLQKDYSKATAMEYMRQCLGAELDDIYVFGDSSNDLVMFEYAKHNVAMGKHDPVLEPYAELIADDVDEDGILHALEKLRLI